MTVVDSIILHGGKQSVSVEGAILASTDSFFYLEEHKVLKSIISISITSEKSDLIGFESVEIAEEEIAVLSINLEQEIERRLERLMKNPLSGFGIIYKFKNQEIKLARGIRYPEEQIVSRLIIMYNFCRRCLERKKNIYFNVTETIPYWGGTEKSEEE